MANNERVNIELTATNRASGVMNRVKDDLGGLESAAGMVTKGFSGLAGAFAVGAITQVVGQIGGAVMEMSNLAAASATVEASFQQLAANAGQSATGMLGQLKAASNGTIAEYDLMLAANRAMMLGVADSSEEMTALMSVAISRGRAMGLSTTQAFSDLVTGLGRASPLILDNLGIVVDAEEVNRKYAEQLGKTAAQLTEVERKQALVNVVMDEAKGLTTSGVDSTADSMARATAAMADLKVAFGELFAPAVVGAAQALTTVFEQAKETIEAAQEVMATPPAATQLAAATAQQQAAHDHIMQAQKTEIEQAYALLQQTEELGVSLYDISYGLDPYIVSLAESIKLTGDLSAQIDNLNAQMSAQRAAAMEAGANRDDGSLAGRRAAELAAEAEALGAYRKAAIDAAMAIDDFANSVAMTAAKGLFDNMGSGAWQYLGELRTKAIQVYQEVFAATNNVEAAQYAAAQAVNALAAEIGKVSPALSNMSNWLGITGTAADSTATQLINLAGTAAAAALGIEQAAGSIRNAGLSALAGAQAIANAKSAIDGMTNVQRAKRGFEDLRDALGSYNAEMEGAKGGAALQEVAYMSYPAAQGVRAVGSQVASLNQEFETLKNTVSGILSGALTLDGINVDSMLPREDEINENARRLAAIANEGLGNQSWMEEFKNEVPDIYAMLKDSGDPRATAQQLLRDFQDGLVPQLLDKEEAKERVRRMLLGQDNMAALANEIAQELSTEMGISLGAAQQAVGATLGTGDAKAPGGLNGEVEGNSFVDGITTTLATRNEEFYSAGAAAGGTWGAGFLAEAEGSIPMALIIMIAGLVKAAQGAEASRTEPN